MNELVETGITVIPIPSGVISQFDLNDFLHGQREFKVSNPDTIYVMGAFGALANPSSQHHPQIRALRSALYNHMFPIFQTAFTGKFLELIADRFSIRNQDQPISSESWHRDCSAIIGPNDLIFGGYINLDTTQTQYFSCVPGSHKDSPESCEGFARLSNKETKQLNDCKRVLIPVPPGHAIIFNELTIHEIAKRKMTQPKSYRQYFKWRISDHPVSTIGEQVIMKALDEQAILPMHAIGNTPLPPMYGKNHIMFWGERLVEFSQNVHHSFLDKPNKRGYVYVKRFMPSLLAAGIELFPPYTPDERSILLPRPL